MTNHRRIKEDSFVVVIDNGVDEPVLGIGETEEAAIDDALRPKWDTESAFDKKHGFSVEVRYAHAEHFYSVYLIKDVLLWTWNDDYLCPVYDDETQEKIIHTTLLRKFKKHGS